MAKRAKIEQLVFGGLNGRVVALNRDNGEIEWEWRPSNRRAAGYVTLILDKDRLIVSVNGYIYAIDPATGEELWENPLKGFGLGIASLASVYNPSSPVFQAQASHAQQQQDAANSAAITAASS
jgi:outer membrane protein assembly factor BamB